MKKTPLLPLAAALMLGAAPAVLAQDEPAHEPAHGRDAAGARATFIDIDGETVGEVRLTQTPHGVLIHGSVSGFEAGGVYGFHVHEIGACDPETDFESAGEHFNPDDREHGYFAQGGPHAGDMPNQTAGADGVIRLDLVNPAVALDPSSLLQAEGTALMLHDHEDDYASQPTGDAGDRLACAMVVSTAPDTGETVPPAEEDEPPLATGDDTAPVPATRGSTDDELPPDAGQDDEEDVPQG